jgi:hypothetical protein
MCGAVSERGGACRAGINVYAHPGGFLVRSSAPGWSEATRGHRRRRGLVRGPGRTTRGFSPTHECRYPARGPPIPAPSEPRASLGSQRRGARSVDASRPAVLVLRDTYYANWHVTVQGKDAHLARVDDIMRGIVVPAGSSTVVFHYHSSIRTIAGCVSVPPSPCSRRPRQSELVGTAAEDEPPAPGAHISRARPAGGRGICTPPGTRTRNLQIKSLML